MGVVFSRFQSLALLHLRCPAGFGVAYGSTTSVPKSTAFQRGYQSQTNGKRSPSRQFENRGKRRLNAVKEQNGVAIHCTFPTVSVFRLRSAPGPPRSPAPLRGRAVSRRFREDESDFTIHSLFQQPTRRTSWKLVGS